MRILSVVLRVLFALLLLTPVLGALGVFPAPTADLYTPEGWAFMSAMMETGYMMPLLGVLCAVCLVLVVIGRTGLAAVLIAPMTVNVMFFHWFLDAAPISASSSLGYVLLVCNVFFLWKHWDAYKPMLRS